MLPEPEPKHHGNSFLVFFYTFLGPLSPKYEVSRSSQALQKVSYAEMGAVRLAAILQDTCDLEHNMIQITRRHLAQEEPMPDSYVSRDLSKCTYRSQR